MYVNIYLRYIYYKLLTEKFGSDRNTYIWEVSRSNLCRDIDNSESFHGFPQSFQTTTGIWPQIMPLPFPVKFFLIPLIIKHHTGLCYVVWNTDSAIEWALNKNTNRIYAFKS
jgi:hypothetical protein